MIATAISAGAALSNLVSGFVVDATGYVDGFLFLAAVAAIALTLFYFGVAETGEPVAHPLAGESEREQLAMRT